MVVEVAKFTTKHTVLPNDNVFIEYPAFTFFTCWAQPMLSFEPYTAPFRTD